MFPTLPHVQNKAAGTANSANALFATFEACAAASTGKVDKDGDERTIRSLCNLRDFLTGLFVTEYSKCKKKRKKRLKYKKFHNTVKRFKRDLAGHRRKRLLEREPSKAASQAAQSRSDEMQNMADVVCDLLLSNEELSSVPIVAADGKPKPSNATAEEHKTCGGRTRKKAMAPLLPLIPSQMSYSFIYNLGEEGAPMLDSANSFDAIFENDSEAIQRSFDVDLELDFDFRDFQEIIRGAKVVDEKIV
jgi:hypothetical protein